MGPIEHRLQIVDIQVKMAHLKSHYYFLALAVRIKQTSIYRLNVLDVCC